MNSPELHTSYLIAFDGSQHSRSAVELLSDLCQTSKGARKIEVHLLTVFTPRQIKDHDLLHNNLMQAKQYLESQQCFSVFTNLILGYPSEKILEIAEQVKADMILMGARGLRATFGILLGGVAQQVVEYASCPVLVSRAPYNGLSHVLLAIDSSAYSQQATSYLRKLNLPPSARLTVMHVLPPLPAEILSATASEIWPIIADQIPLSSSSSMRSVEDAGWLVEEENQGRDLLASALDYLKSAGREAEPLLLRGDAATEIINFAKDNKIELIIAGSRGLSQLRGLFIGSVSRKLVHYADSSVLIVKSPTYSPN